MLNINDTKFNGLNVFGKWISNLESTNSRNEKENILEQARVLANQEDNTANAFLYNCYLTYNPFLVFNIKQVPTTDGLTNKENPWPEFWTLCEELHSRAITGNIARDMVAKLSERFDSDNWNNACHRVLTKDLRVGISEKTLNKVLKNTCWEIPVFSCQLATDSNNQPSKMTGIKQLEIKLDGVRTLAIVTADGVTLMSRNGKPFDNFGHIADDIMEKYSSLTGIFGDSFVLDGEVIGESFQNLMKQARRKSDVDTSDTVFHVFDVLSLADFQAGRSLHVQSIRTDMLLSSEVFFENTAIKIVDHIIVDLDTDSGLKNLNAFSEQALLEGYEGIMIKDVGAPYKCKRTTDWLKLKPIITVDLSIVDVEEGTGKNQGRLGALICEGQDNGRNIRVNVGTGFTDSDRISYWLERDYLHGRMVEVQADVVTQNQDGTHSLRFPRFVRFRSFSDAPSEKV